MAEPMEAMRRPVLQGGRGGAASVRISPAEPAGRLSLRAGTDAVAALSKVLGVSLPVKPKSSASANGRTALWLGPDEWLLIDEVGGNLVADCAKSGAVHSAVDVSHRNTAMIVSGPGAAATINAGCPLDLSLAVFPAGAASRTVFGKVEIVLHRIDEETFRLECWRSFADYAFGLLSEAAEDAGA